MNIVELSFDELVRRFEPTLEESSFALPDVWVVNADADEGVIGCDIPARLGAIIVARGYDHTETPPPWCDVVAQSSNELDDIIAMIARSPRASTMLCQVLRHSVTRGIDDGLLIESAVYSTLQAGPEFASWRSSTPARHRPVAAEPVIVERHGAQLMVTLNRPEVHNALNSAMRDALIEAYQLVALDATIESVEVRGRGPSFSSGGDLDEFGSFADPSSAHLVRLHASVAHHLAVVADRVHVALHGASLGSGIELPAFAARVTASPDTRIGLPELGIGLIPGAGGTVSLPRRIGRHRTAWLALSGRTIDAGTAKRWGLIDAIADPQSPADAN